MSFATKLAAIKRRHTFVSRSQSRYLASELIDLLDELRQSNCTPKAGLKSMVSFYEADEKLFNMCDDSNGSLGNVFRGNASEVFAEFASRCDDSTWLLDLIIKVSENDDYGVRIHILDNVKSFLSEKQMRELADSVFNLAQKEENTYKHNHWLYMARNISEQLLDTTLFEKVSRELHDGELHEAATLHLAELHFVRGEFEMALNLLDSISSTTFRAVQRDELLTKIFRAQNDTQKLSEISWKTFLNFRSKNTLDELLSAIGEGNRNSIVKNQTEKILEDQEFESSDAVFLIECDRIDDAELHIIANRDKLGQEHYTQLLLLAKPMLEHKKYLAASIVYRELLESILARSISKYYRYGISYLKKLDSIAPEVTDWRDVQPHGDYVIDLRKQHKFKSSFWGHYDQK